MHILIDKIHDLPIHSVIEKYTTIEKAGTGYKAKCPFPGHDDKTASFHVSDNKGICKCFGCGRGGDAISFVQTMRGYAKPWEAMLEIAKGFNLPIPEQKELTPEQEEQYRKKEQLKIVYEVAAEYYRENLFKVDNCLALEYTLSRTTKELIDKFTIGYADKHWTGLYDYMREKNFKNEILLESKLVSEKNGKFFDFFRDRIMVPLCDRSGSVVAFSGRIMPGAADDQPKYINSPESEIFSKRNTLFALNQARTAISKKEGVYLVEGQFDVLRLFSIGVENAVAPSGTALSAEQLAEIKRYSHNLVLIYDRDSAGTKATDRSGLLAIDSGFNCNVVMLPSTDGEKQDPDSFFKSHKQFSEYKDCNIMDFIVWKTWQMEKNIKGFPDRKSKAINEICKLILKYENGSRQDIYLDHVSKIIPDKALWKKEINLLTKEQNKKETIVVVPEGVSLKDFERFGFYTEKNCYWFNKGTGVVRASNFVMKPMFHIQSTLNAKRLFEVTNEHGIIEVIELLQKDMVSLPAFKLRIESLGNFLWEAGEPELNRLKRYLYEKTDTCFEITQLGWQKHGFFAWSNGIYNGQFTGIDKHGIVNHDQKKYYLPALSDIYDKDDSLFMSERKFIHLKNNTISLTDYCNRLVSVFGDNAKIAIAFLMATLYRDLIIKRFNNFPILNLFGPKGAGKTELAVSIMSFFGHQGKGPNINNTSKASLADHVSQVRNACVHIDEYKNSVEYEKIEFLKGLWDGTGRTRMNMDKDKKKETTAVDSGVILSGQEMPTADIALFSRLIYLTFHKVEYTEAEKLQFDELKELEKKGLTHLTNEILSHRGYFIEKYQDCYDATCEMFREQLKTDTVEARLFNNWAMVIAAYVTLKDKIEVPFSINQMIKQAVSQLLVQQRETRTGNEVTSFWNIIQFLWADGQIQEQCDFDIESCIKLTVEDKSFEWLEPKRVIFVQHSRILPLYQKFGKQVSEKILPTASIDFYLRNDRRFLGKKPTHRFRNIDPNTKQWDTVKPWKVTTSYVFDYDALNKDIGITMHSESDQTEIKEVQLTSRYEKEVSENKKLPF
jgi:DNA primase